MFLTSDPATDADMKRLQDRVRQEIKNAEIEPGRAAESLVGVGGTITTLAMIDLGLRQYDRKQIQGYRLGTKRLSELRAWLQKTPLAERKQIAGLPPERADVIVAGAAIFETATEFLEFDEIIVSTRGLRHGVLISASTK
jgi:exopolyphosphatase/guanosine-5'-triphosphate,3'-diphosphate pyrophosphatase